MAVTRARRLKALVGSRISEIRRSKALTQEQLAAKLDVTTQWFSRVENGHENLTLETVNRIAIALRVEVSEFFVDGDEQGVPLRVSKKPGKRR